MADLEEKKKISQLLDFYGDLLTERQRDFLDLHYNEDLSYGEIAESEHISRQAVHDTIQHGRKALLRFEEHLGLLYRDNMACYGQTVIEPIRHEVDELAGFLKEDIIYNVEPLRRRVRNLKELLAALPGKTGDEKGNE